MSSFWQATPFVGALLSLSLLPLLVPAFWHRFENYILGFWGVLSVAAIIKSTGTNSTETYGAAHIIFETLWDEYIPFVALIFALFTITGGVHIHLHSRGTPFKNVFLLATASFMASFVGTTGASILFIRPLLHFNKDRTYIIHTVVFFIFIVSNIAGCLTPLGDPPLFLGYLMKVPFFWPLTHLWQPFLFVFVALITVYWGVDTYFFKHEASHSADIPFKMSIEGKRNIALLLLIIITVVAAPSLPAIQITEIFGVYITLPDCISVLLFLGIGLLSYCITPHHIHKKQHFNFHPVSEIARVFLCIFITLAPVSQMLASGKNGPFAPLLAIMATADPAPYYFWLTGLFSSFLDNAPTYVVFFELAGGNAVELTTTHSPILVAISLGAVFMGALTYIGNAPNFMVRSIAKQHGISMPSFLGYMAWSLIILLPLFLIMSLIWI
ncbi:MAG: sodium:proton antiporter [Pseudomonadota bacterium]